MAQARYTKDHEWIRQDGNVAVVGITDYAQGQLGDIVYVELPAVGKAVKKGTEAAVVESVKAASEVYAPATGKVVAVNGALDLQLAEVIGQVDLAEARPLRHVAEQAVDRGHADFRQHGPSIGVGERQIAHQCSPLTYLS